MLWLNRDLSVFVPLSLDLLIHCSVVSRSHMWSRNSQINHTLDQIRCFPHTATYLRTYTYICVFSMPPCPGIYTSPLPPLLLPPPPPPYCRAGRQIPDQRAGELIRSCTDAICQSQPEGGAQSQEVRTLTVPRLSPPSLSKHTNGAP